ncbi:MAG: serine protease [Treponema sp.]|nr:serine protease [Candidatus Treponema scatequi]
MNKQFKSTLLIAAAASCLFSSCISSPKVEPGEHKEELDYTQEDVRKAEIERINKMMLNKPIEALWRAVLLGDKDEIAASVTRVKEYLSSSLEEKDYLELYYGFKSLENSGFLKDAEEVISKNELEKLFFNQIPGAGIKKSSTKIENMNTCISGTVTVWVDLGIKVQSGMGFANRVIGSGFFIDERGYIITNHHVIADIVDPKYEGYGKVYIKLYGDEDTRIPAKVIGWDSIHDLALLKTEIKPPYVFSLGSSSDLRAGDKIYAIGSPLGLESTLTSGVVSSTNRKLFTTGSVFQIDAAVNSGNSGGPCIDINGNVQAIVFAGIQQYQGLNFAIPVEYLKQELAILYYGGLREVPWIGAYGHTYKSGLKGTGVEVQYFAPGSALARAGISRGDVITAIDGHPVNTIEEVQGVLRSLVSGMIVKVDYLDSEKQKKNCPVYLTGRPKCPGYFFYQNDSIENSFVPLYGVSLIPASTTNSRTYLITNVIKGSIADESGFSENDPITVGRVQFNDDKSMMYAELTVKRRKKGYLDVTIGLPTNLDSPYYF